MWIGRTQRRQTIGPTTAAIGIRRGAGLSASTYGVDQCSNHADNDNANAAAAVPMGGASEMEASLFARESQFEDDDDDLEANKIYAVINERMSNKRKRNNNDNYNINC